MAVATVAAVAAVAVVVYGEYFSSQMLNFDLSGKLASVSQGRSEGTY